MIPMRSPRSVRQTVGRSSACIRTLTCGLVIVAGHALPLRAAANRSALRLRGQLMTRWSVAEQPDDWSNRASLERARVEVRWKPDKRLRLVIELEGHDGFALKDAYVRLDPWPWIRLTAGHFKKPFSRLRLDSLADLPLPERGLLDHNVVRRTRYGGFGARDFGLMLTGRFKRLARLRVDLGAFSGDKTLDGRDEQHHDLVERAQVRPFKGARLAVDASHKRYELAEATHWAHLIGVDARWKLGPSTLQLEGATGDNVDAGRGHRLWGAHAIESVMVGLPHRLGLEPAAMFEVFDPDDQVAGGRGYRIAGALNLHFKEWLRLILFGEHTFGQPRMTDPQREGEVVAVPVETRILLQLNVDLAWTSASHPKAAPAASAVVRPVSPARRGGP